MDNYDQFFRRVDSLAAVPRNGQSAYQFNSQYPSNLVGGRTLQDLAVTDAKIASVSADKIVSGTIDASVITVSNLSPSDLGNGTLDTSMDVGTATGGRYIRLDGANGRIVSYDGTTNRGVFGEV